jgi:CRP-like cAMP-binding protein
MYFLKKGMIRLYKKKGDAVIELDTVHTGSVLGELAFLDGNPRSASGEALTECELIEISGSAFQQTLVGMPDWLKILLKTIVTRLRTASTRIRQLESVSTAYDYSDKESNKRSAQYIYLSPIEVLKICTSILLMGTRYGTEIRVPLLQRYANQIMGVPVAKISTMMDILATVEILSITDEQNATKVVLKDIDFLEKLISYLNDENLTEPSKRHDLSPRSFQIMTVIQKHLVKYRAEEGTGQAVINVAEIRSVEQALVGKDPFRLDELQDLVKLGYLGNLSLKSGSEAFSAVHVEKFNQAYRYQRVVMTIAAANQQKKSSTKR